MKHFRSSFWTLASLRIAFLAPYCSNTASQVQVQNNQVKLHNELSHRKEVKHRVHWWTNLFQNVEIEKMIVDWRDLYPATHPSALTIPSTRDHREPADQLHLHLEAVCGDRWGQHRGSSRPRRAHWNLSDTFHLYNGPATTFMLLLLFLYGRKIPINTYVQHFSKPCKKLTIFLSGE